MVTLTVLISNIAGSTQEVEDWLLHHLARSACSEFTTVEDTNGLDFLRTGLDGNVVRLQTTARLTGGCDTRAVNVCELTLAGVLGYPVESVHLHRLCSLATTTGWRTIGNDPETV